MREEPEGGSRSRSLMDAVLRAHRRLFVSFDPSEAIPEALAVVGEASGVDRVYIFRLRSGASGVVTASQRYEWTASTVSPQIDNPDLQELPLVSAGYRRWLERFTSYQPVYGPVDEFPASERAVLEAQQIESLIVLPIFAGAELWGFVGFDDCRERRVWTGSDLNLLLSLAISLGAAVMREEPAPGTSSRHSAAASNARITGYAAISGHLLLNGGLESTSVDQAVRIVEARIGSLVWTHRFLRARADSEPIALHEYLHAMEEHFTFVGRSLPVTAAAEGGGRSARIRTDILPPVGMLVSETLACLRPTTAAAGVSRLTVSSHGDGCTGCVTVNGYGPSGEPVPVSCECSPASMLFARRLLEPIPNSAGPRVAGDTIVVVCVPAEAA